MISHNYTKKSAQSDQGFGKKNKQLKNQINWPFSAIFGQKKSIFENLSPSLFFIHFFLTCCKESEKSYGFFFWTYYTLFSTSVELEFGIVRMPGPVVDQSFGTSRLRIFLIFFKKLGKIK